VTFVIHHTLGIIMSDFSQPTNLLCLTCGNLILRTDLFDTCPKCASRIDVHELLRLYEYAAHVYYYGHQYRLAYETQQQPEKKVRYCIEFAGEAFAWTTLAVLSGVVGNAAYDIVHKVIENVRDAVADGRIPDRDYSALLSLSDEELGDLLSSAKSYTNDMNGLNNEVRLAIIEEIAVDAITEQPQLMAQLMKFMKGGKISDKGKKKFAKQLRTTITQQQRRILPKKGELNDRWTRIDPH